jgi:hypothetical protein
MELLLGNEVLPKHVASMHEESTGFPFQKSTDEVGVKIDIHPIENVILSSLIRNKSKPLKPELKGKR